MKKIFVAAIEEKGLEPLQIILKKLGGWPVLDGDSWNDGDFDWRSSIYKFRDAGYSVDYFIDFSIGVDLKNSTQRLIDVSICFSQMEWYKIPQDYCQFFIIHLSISKLRSLIKQL